MALYHKYRPQGFDSVVGQNPIVRTLQNALLKQQLNHAYLFCGPRGTGKTSLARILAKAANCTAPQKTETSFNPCGECPPCQSITEGSALDVIEIDAASHTGVDNIRELREQAYFQPAALRYKVYIIDEVHMLSKGAFNALLKILEEPPAHVIFILATTEAHEVPLTVLSRCQRYDFRPVDIQDMTARLGTVAEAEGYTFDPAALEIIATQARGALRDGLSLLEQVMATGAQNYTAQEVRNLLGLAETADVAALFGKIAEGKTGEVIGQLGQLEENGAGIAHYLRAMLQYARALLLVKLSGEMPYNASFTQEEKTEIKRLTEQFDAGVLQELVGGLINAAQQIRRVDWPLATLEITVVNAMHQKGQGETNPMPARQHKTSKPESNVQASPTSNVAATPVSTSPTTPEPKSPDKVTVQTPPPQPEVPKPSPPPERTAPESTPKRPTTAGDGPMTFDLIMRSWDNFLEACKPRNHSIVAFLRGGKPVDLKGSVVVMEFYYSFHKEQIEKSTNRRIVEDVLTEFFGQALTLRCQLGSKDASPGNTNETPTPQAPPAPTASPPPAQSPPKQAEPHQEESTPPAENAGQTGNEDEIVSEALKIFGGKVIEPPTTKPDNTPT